MSGRYAELVERQAGVREIGTVLNSVRAIAASRAQQAREALRAVDRYSAGLVGALSKLADLLPSSVEANDLNAMTALVVFGAEEGFAGTFSERLLSTIGERELIFLVGTRAASVAGDERLTIHWSTAMSSHVAGIPRLADTIAQALFAQVADGRIGRVAVRYADFRSGGAFQVKDESLVPLDETAFRSSGQGRTPLLQRSVRGIFDDVAADYIHARLCRAALHSLAAENETRSETMARARREIARHVEELDRDIRLMRHEQITDEVIELSAAGQ